MRRSSLLFIIFIGVAIAAFSMLPLILRPFSSGETQDYSTSSVMRLKEGEAILCVSAPAGAEIHISVCDTITCAEITTLSGDGDNYPKVSYDAETSTLYISEEENMIYITMPSSAGLMNILGRGACDAIYLEGLSTHSLIVSPACPFISADNCMIGQLVIDEGVEDRKAPYRMYASSCTIEAFISAVPSSEMDLSLEECSLISLQFLR